MKDLTVRKAVQGDMGAVLDLIRELAVFEKEPDAVAVTLSDLENYGFGQKKMFDCLVAEYDGQVVGIALYYPRFSTWKGPTLHLEDLIVKEKHRGKGIGLSLYRAFLKDAFAKAVERVEWVVLDWNTDAIRFYENSGATVMTDWNTVQMDRAAIKKFVGDAGI